MKTATKLNQLFNDTEELLAELEDQHGPEVEELRDRLGKFHQERPARLSPSKGNLRK